MERKPLKSGLTLRRIVESFYRREITDENWPEVRAKVLEVARLNDEALLEGGLNKSPLSELLQTAIDFPFPEEDKPEGSSAV